LPNGRLAGELAASFELVEAELKKLIVASHSRKTVQGKDILASVHAMERILGLVLGKPRALLRT
jgi:hypothetical protein